MATIVSRLLIRVVTPPETASSRSVDSQIEQALVGHDVNMTFDVALTDADGDSAVSQIDITLTANSVAPAGVAGEPINLALTAPSAAAGAFVTVMVADVPSGWTINGGTLLDDGTWTVQTTDPRSLSITSPADFTGAILLNVTETWTKADGSTVSVSVADNVEVYPVRLSDLRLVGARFPDRLERQGPVRLRAAYRRRHDLQLRSRAKTKSTSLAMQNFTSFSDVQRHLTEDSAAATP